MIKCGIHPINPVWAIIYWHRIFGSPYNRRSWRDYGQYFDRADENTGMPCITRTSSDEQAKSCRSQFYAFFEANEFG